MAKMIGGKLYMHPNTYINNERPIKFDSDRQRGRLDCGRYGVLSLCPPGSYGCMVILFSSRLYLLPAMQPIIFGTFPVVCPSVPGQS